MEENYEFLSESSMSFEEAPELNEEKLFNKKLKILAMPDRHIKHWGSDETDAKVAAARKVYNGNNEDKTIRRIINRANKEK